MRLPCLHSRPFGAAFLLAFWLGQAATVLASQDIVGLYRHKGPIAATLEVAREADRYVVRLEGGVPSGQGAATPANCVIEARGSLEGGALHGHFIPVETDTFSDGAVQAERDDRTVEILFEQGRADVVKADIFGYCGLGADFSGEYHKVDQLSD